MVSIKLIVSERSNPGLISRSCKGWNKVIKEQFYTVQDILPRRGEKIRVAIEGREEPVLAKIDWVIWDEPFTEATIKASLFEPA